PGRPAAAAPAAGAAPARPVYRVLRTNQLDEYDKPVAPEAITAEAAAAPRGDQFAGTARKAAKLSIRSGQTEVLRDLKEVIASFPSEQAMKHHQPPITTAAQSKRVTEEQRNVRIRGFLYAASRETDNDFHLIVGRDPGSPVMYMTMEVSG